MISFPHNAEWLIFWIFYNKIQWRAKPFFLPKSLSSQYHLWKKPFPPLGDLLHYLYLLWLISEPPTVISYPFLPENISHYANSIIHVNIRYRFPSLIIFKVFSACLFFQMTWSFTARLGVVMLTCPPALGRLRQGDCGFHVVAWLCVHTCKERILAVLSQAQFS